MAKWCINEATPNCAELIAKFAGRAVKGELVIIIPPPTRAERREMDEEPEVMSLGGEAGGSAVD